MSAGIHTNHRSFGKPSEQADTLVIELSSYSIDFCEIISDLNQPVYTVHAPIDNSSAIPAKEQVISAIRHFRFSQKVYRVVYINFFTSKFTLCPSSFYDEDHKRQILEFNTGPVGDDIILRDDVSQEIRLVYAIDEHLKPALDLIFPNHHMKHSLTVLSQMMLYSEDLASAQILVQIHDSNLAMVIRQDGKLLLTNLFSVNSTEDILYYILFALEQYQLEPSSVELTIVGNTDSQSEAVLALRKYIRHVRLGMGSRSVNWQALEGMPQHFNYSLINRIFCES